MIALVAAVVLGQVSVGVEAGGAYGVSLRPAYGALAGVTVSPSEVAWLEGGLLLGYQAEPYAIYDAYLGGAHVRGATHRLQVLGTGGVRFRVWRVALAPHVVVGWSKVWLSGSFDNELQNVHGRLEETVGAFTLGLGAAVSFQVVERVQVRARVVGPLPFSSGVTGYMTVSLGVVVEF